MFGPSKNDIWQQLSREIGADFEPDGFFRSGKVVLKHRQWKITLDTYTEVIGDLTNTYTRMRAPYVNPNGFHFDVYRRGIFSGLAGMFGREEIMIGDAEFDSRFCVRSSSPPTVQRLLENSEIRRLIKTQPNIRLAVKDDEGWFGVSFPNGVDELYSEVPGVIKEKKRLKELFDLFSAVLDELCVIGAADDRRPGVIL